MRYNEIVFFSPPISQSFSAQNSNVEMKTRAWEPADTNLVFGLIRLPCVLFS